MKPVIKKEQEKDEENGSGKKWGINEEKEGTGTGKVIEKRKRRKINKINLDEILNLGEW